jgi:tRNA threonylcarbamoyladenosine dehydratase
MAATTVDPVVHVSQESFDNNDTDDDEGYQLRFGGVGRLLAGRAYAAVTADTVLQRLRSATVVVIGLGGVGSWAAEALCRSGVGHLILIDLDDICISNTNRQVHSLDTTTGQLKIAALRERFCHINPQCNVSLIADFVTVETVNDIFAQVRRLQEQFSRQDDHAVSQHSATTSTGTGSSTLLVLDAIDGAREKAAILAYCDAHQLPIVTCGGAAGRSDPSLVATTDLTLVQGDKLLASCKKELRKYHGFDAGLSFRELQKGRRVPKWNIDCVYSQEDIAAVLPPALSDASSSSFRLCDGSLGTACYVTGTFGFAAAKAIVDKIAYNKLAPPKGRSRRQRQAQ